MNRNIKLWIGSFVVPCLMFGSQTCGAAAENIILILSDSQNLNSVQTTKNDIDTQAVYEPSPVKSVMPETSNIPEPATLILLGLGSLVLFRRRA